MCRCIYFIIPLCCVTVIYVQSIAAVEVDCISRAAPFNNMPVKTEIGSTCRNIPGTAYSHIIFKIVAARRFWKTVIACPHSEVDIVMHVGLGSQLELVALFLDNIDLIVTGEAVDILCRLATSGEHAGRLHCHSDGGIGSQRAVDGDLFLVLQVHIFNSISMLVAVDHRAAGDIESTDTIAVDTATVLGRRVAGNAATSQRNTGRTVALSIHMNTAASARSCIAANGTAAHAECTTHRDATAPAGSVVANGAT